MIEAETIEEYREQARNDYRELNQLRVALAAERALAEQMREALREARRVWNQHAEESEEWQALAAIDAALAAASPVERTDA